MPKVRLRGCSINEPKFVFGYKHNLHSAVPIIVIYIIKKRRYKDECWIFVRAKVIGVWSINGEIKIRSSNQGWIEKGLGFDDDGEDKSYRELDLGSKRKELGF